MRPVNQNNAVSGQLPRELADLLAKPLTRFLRIEAAGGAVLLLFTLAALLLSNSPWSHLFLSSWEVELGFHIDALELSRPLREWINDGLMTLFFFLVALELKRELVLGELSQPRMAALSIAAALGGMLVPAACYLVLQWGKPGEIGWGTVMATDTAFVVGCLMLLGARIPKSLRVFMLSLAIFDDIGAILIVTIAYSQEIRWDGLAVAGIGVLATRGMTMAGVRGFLPYIAVSVAMWLAVDASGVHATITGVILGLMTPARRWVSDERLYAILDKVVAHPSKSTHGSAVTEDRQTLLLAERAARESLSPAERLVMVLHPWVGFVIMPLFAFANAGLTLAWADLDNSVTLAVFIGFALGKPVGILAFCGLAVGLGLAARPVDLSWKLITGGALLAGIGFTMALFIGNLALSGSLLASAKMGILLASLFSALAGITLLMTVPVRKSAGT